MKSKRIKWSVTKKSEWTKEKIQTEELQKQIIVVYSVKRKLHTIKNYPLLDNTA